MRRTISFALAAVLAVVAFACTSREEKKVAPVDAEGITQDQEALDQLGSAGSNLSKPHRIDFYLYLPSQPDAEGAEAELRSLGYSVTVRVGPDNINWQCVASRTMTPTIQALTDARDVLKAMAMRYRGAYDGWQAAIER